MASAASTHSRTDVLKKKRNLATSLETEATNDLSRNTASEESHDPNEATASGLGGVLQRKKRRIAVTLIRSASKKSKPNFSAIPQSKSSIFCSESASTTVSHASAASTSMASICTTSGSTPAAAPLLSSDGAVLRQWIPTPSLSPPAMAKEFLRFGTQPCVRFIGLKREHAFCKGVDSKTIAFFEEHMRDFVEVNPYRMQSSSAGLELLSELAKRQSEVHSGGMVAKLPRPLQPCWTLLKGLMQKGFAIPFVNEMPAEASNGNIKAVPSLFAMQQKLENAAKVHCDNLKAEIAVAVRALKREEAKKKTEEKTQEVADTKVESTMDSTTMDSTTIDSATMDSTTMDSTMESSTDVVMTDSTTAIAKTATKTIVEKTAVAKTSAATKTAAAAKTGKSGVKSKARPLATGWRRESPPQLEERLPIYETVGEFAADFRLIVDNVLAINSMSFMRHCEGTRRRLVKMTKEQRLGEALSSKRTDCLAQSMQFVPQREGKEKWKEYSRYYETKNDPYQRGGCNTFMATYFMSDSESEDDVGMLDSDDDTEKQSLVASSSMSGLSSIKRRPTTCEPSEERLRKEMYEKKHLLRCAKRMSEYFEMRFANISPKVSMGEHLSMFRHISGKHSEADARAAIAQVFDVPPAAIELQSAFVTAKQKLARAAMEKKKAEDKRLKKLKAAQRAAANSQSGRSVKLKLSSKKKRKGGGQALDDGSSFKARAKDISKRLGRDQKLIFPPLEENQIVDATTWYLCIFEEIRTNIRFRALGMDGAEIIEDMVFEFTGKRREEVVRGRKREETGGMDPHTYFENLSRNLTSTVDLRSLPNEKGQQIYNKLHDIIFTWLPSAKGGKRRKQAPGIYARREAKLLSARRQARAERMLWLQKDAEQRAETGATTKRRRKNGAVVPISVTKKRTSSKRKSKSKSRSKSKSKSKSQSKSPASKGAGLGLVGTKKKRTKRHSTSRSPSPKQRRSGGEGSRRKATAVTKAKKHSRVSSSAKTKTRKSKSRSRSPSFAAPMASARKGGRQLNKSQRRLQKIDDEIEATMARRSEVSRNSDFYEESSKTQSNDVTMHLFPGECSSDEDEDLYGDGSPSPVPKSESSDEGEIDYNAWLAPFESETSGSAAAAPRSAASSSLAKLADSSSAIANSSRAEVLAASTAMASSKARLRAKRLAINLLDDDY